MSLQVLKEKYFNYYETEKQHSDLFNHFARLPRFDYPSGKAAFDLNYSISEKIYQTLQEKGMTKRDLARLTGKKESEVSRWFSFGHNFTCKTIALIQMSLGVTIVQVPQ